MCGQNGFEFNQIQYVNVYESFSFVFITERELALKFFSTLSGVKTDKLEMLDQKINQDQSEGRCEIGDSGKIEKALHALARYLPLTFNWKLPIQSCKVL